MTFRLTKDDKKAISAFIDKKKYESKKLESTGKQLDGSWFGGYAIAKWVSGKIFFNELGDKSSKVVQRAIKKEAPYSLLLEGDVSRTKSARVEKLRKKTFEQIDNLLAVQMDVTHENRTKANLQKLDDLVLVYREKFGAANRGPGGYPEINSKKKNPKSFEDYLRRIERYLFKIDASRQDADFALAQSFKGKRFEPQVSAIQYFSNDIKQSAKGIARTLKQMKDAPRENSGAIAKNQRIEMLKELNNIIDELELFTGHNEDLGHLNKKMVELLESATGDVRRVFSAAMNDFQVDYDVEDFLDEYIYKNPKKKRKKNTYTGRDSDEHLEAYELRMYIENDGNLYRQMMQPIQKNLVNKKARGIYDSKKAEKAFYNLANEGAQRYAKDFNMGTWHVAFPVAVRKETAKQLVEDFEPAMRDGEFDHLLHKKYKKKNPKIKGRVLYGSDIPEQTGPGIHYEDMEEPDYNMDVDELILRIENDDRLYHQMVLPIYKNLATKNARGVYDSKKAEKLFYHLTNEAGKRFAKDYGSGNWFDIVPVSMRKEAAKELTRRFEPDMKAGYYDDMLPKKYRKNSGKKKKRKSNPSIPGVLVELGKVTELKINKGKDVHQYNWPVRSAPKLCCNPEGTKLFIFQTSKGKSKKADSATMNRAKSRFDKWNDGEAKQTNPYKVKDGPLKAAGSVEHIVYDSPKWQRKDRYIHTFDNEPSVKMDNIKNPSTIMITGKGLKVKPEGIVG